MPKRKKQKPLIEMTTPELAEHIFGKEVKEKLDQVVRQLDEKPATKSSQK